MRASPSGKASAFQADIRGFESHRPLFLFKTPLEHFLEPKKGQEVFYYEYSNEN